MLNVAPAFALVKFAFGIQTVCAVGFALRLVTTAIFAQKTPSDVETYCVVLSTWQYGDAREANRKPDARAMEARLYSRFGLATHLAAKRSGSRDEDCPICEAIR